MTTMRYFAEVIHGVVQRTIVADQDFIDTGSVGDPANWVETSQDTKGGVNAKGEAPLRKNYAMGGYSYDSVLDAFIAPKPFASWVLDETSCLWKAPVPRPTDGKVYEWNEALNNWTEVPSTLENQEALAYAARILDAN